MAVLGDEDMRIRHCDPMFADAVERLGQDEQRRCVATCHTASPRIAHAIGRGVEQGWRRRIGGVT